MKRIFIPLIMIAVVLSGCAGTSKPAAEPIIIESKDSNINLLDRKIENLKDTMTLSFASMDEYYIQRTTKLHSKLDRIEAENDEMEIRLDTLISVIRNIKMPEAAPEIEIPEIVEKDTFMDDYKDALNKFYYQRYGDAVEIFERLYQQNPKHYMAGNVKYWTGESYYALRQYKKAYNAFNEVFNTNAFDKYDDTQLKLGFCYFKMGKMRSAVQEFQNLITYYPNSEHVSIAIRQIGIIEQYSE